MVRKNLYNQIEKGYHLIESGITYMKTKFTRGIMCDDTLSKDSNLAYQKRISELESEVRHLEAELSGKSMMSKSAICYKQKHFKVPESFQINDQRGNSAEIGTDSFLGMILLRTNEIEVSEAYKIRDEVISTYPEIWIDYTREAVDEAINLEPRVFVREGGKYIRGKNTQKYFDSDYISNWFISKIPNDAKQKIENIIARHI